MGRVAEQMMDGEGYVEPSREDMEVVLPTLGTQRITRNGRIHTVVGINRYSSTVYTVHVPDQGEPYMNHWELEHWWSKTTVLGNQVTVEQMHDAFAKAGLKDGVL